MQIIVRFVVYEWITIITQIIILTLSNYTYHVLCYYFFFFLRRVNFEFTANYSLLHAIAVPGRIDAATFGT